MCDAAVEYQIALRRVGMLATARRRRMERSCLGLPLDEHSRRTKAWCEATSLYIDMVSVFLVLRGGLTLEAVEERRKLEAAGSVRRGQRALRGRYVHRR